jgi:plastocyanin
MVVLVGAACSGDGGGPTTGPTAEPSTQPSEQPSEEPSEEPTGSGGITVDLINFAYSPDEIVAAPGSTITLRNTNPSTPHTFTIEGEAIDVDVAPQTIETVTLDIGPGTYQLACQFHGGQGMVGTITLDPI